MRKTLNINLGGMAFIIDENAYELLHNYLEALKQKFNNAAERDEIMSDIEGRIAEMLGQKLAFVAEFNPLYHLVVILRDPLVGRIPDAGDWLWAAGSAAVGWLVAFWIYGRYRDRFAYWY